MKALLAKDRHWIAMFLIGGLAAMVATLCCYSFVDVFVIDGGREDALFYLAWSLGMALGVVAACFDELFGTKDYLMQRAIGPRDVLRARIVGCAIVLAGWIALVPVFAYAVFLVVDPTWQAGHWQQVPRMCGTMVPAISACALGLCAGSLPAPWWVRLVVLGSLFALSFSAVYWWQSGAEWNQTDWSVLVAGHLGIAVAALAWTWCSAGSRFDADLPIPARFRRIVLVPGLVLAACVVAFGLTVLTSNAVSRLHRAYPSLLRHEGKHVLATRPEWREPWVVVDAEHRPTGQRIERANGLNRGGYGIYEEFLRIEPPRSRGLTSTCRVGTGRVVATFDGDVWWCPYEEGPVRVPKSATEDRFGPGVRVHGWSETGAQGAAVVVAYVLGDDALHRFDTETMRFQRVPLAEGDLVSGITNDATDYEDLPEVSIQIGKYEGVLLGDQFAYAFRDGELLRIGRTRKRERSEPEVEDLRGHVDVFGYTVAVPGRLGGEPFRHEFTPRTLVERTWAGLAIAFTAVRPPLLQTVAGCTTDERAGVHNRMVWHWLFDPVVAEGRRWWLVGLAWVVAALSAWLVRRRLRVFAADRSTLRFWTIATWLLGPAAALCGLLCERPRMYVRRVEVPAPAPRLVSVTSTSESLT